MKRQRNLDQTKLQEKQGGLPSCLTATRVSLCTLEPLVLFSSFFPTYKEAQSCTTYLPLEDRFYLMGFVSILRTETLRVSMLWVCLCSCDDAGVL